MSEDGLEPIGELVKDTREFDLRSPQARHHFTPF